MHDLIFDPLIWLGASITLLAMSLTALLVMAFPVMQDLTRLARSTEKLLDTLDRELPNTLDSLRTTGKELSDLTEDLGDSMERVKQVVQRVDQGVTQAGQQWQQAQITSRSAIAGLRAAWNTFLNGDRPSSQPQFSSQPRPVVPPSPGQRASLDFSTTSDDSSRPHPSPQEPDPTIEASLGHSSALGSSPPGASLDASPTTTNPQDDTTPSRPQNPDEIATSREKA